MGHSLVPALVFLEQPLLYVCVPVCLCLCGVVSACVCGVCVWCVAVCGPPQHSAFLSAFLQLESVAPVWGPSDSDVHTSLFRRWPEQVSPGAGSGPGASQEAPGGGVCPGVHRGWLLYPGRPWLLSQARVLGAWEQEGPESLASWKQTRALWHPRACVPSWAPRHSVPALAVGPERLVRVRARKLALLCPRPPAARLHCSLLSNVGWLFFLILVGFHGQPLYSLHCSLLPLLHTSSSCPKLQLKPCSFWM